MDEVSSNEPEVNAKPEQFFILLPLLLSFLLLTVSIIKRRARRDIRVNCWFCNQNFSVPRGNANCFDCPNCEQYNGFQEDGDYNKPIPAQYDEDLNFPVIGSTPRRDHLRQTWTNGLCIQCNHNQAVKIKLLATFQPVIQSNEDEEMKAYVSHLENLYRLCWRCQVQVCTILEQQDTELAPSLPHPSPKIADSVIENPKIVKRLERVLRFVVIVAESLGWLCSLYIFLVHSSPLWSLLYLSSKWPLEQGFPSLALRTGFSSKYDGTVCVAALFLTVFATVLNKANRNMSSMTKRLSLWILMMLWSDSNVDSWIPKLTYTAFFGDKFLVCLLLTVLSFKSLLVTFTAKCKQHRIQKRPLRVECQENETKFKNSSAVADWITACNTCHTQVQQQQPTKPHNVALAPFTPKRLQLDHAFDQMHISMTKQYTFVSPSHLSNVNGTHGQRMIEKCYSGKGRSLLKPAHLFSTPPSKAGQSVSQTSWVAGGLWSSSASTSGKQKVQATFLGASVPVKEGLLTPPPSLDGSQASQPDSMINEGVASSGKSVFADCGRSWPPSHSSLRQRSSASPTTVHSALNPNVKPRPEEDQKRSGKRMLNMLRKAAVLLSVGLNLVIITHFVWRQVVR